MDDLVMAQQNHRETVHPIWPDGGHKTDDRSDEQIVTNAVVKAAELLDISTAELAKILGVAPKTAKRYKDRESVLSDGSKSEEAGLYLIRIFKALGVFYGGHFPDMKRWLRSEHYVLGGKPIDKLYRIDGLVRTADYLDGARSKV